MLDFNKEELCYGCEACSNICPKSAITMTEGYDGFIYPIINEDKCISCGMCNKVCPVLNKKEGEKKLAEREALAIYNKDESIRKESSSGGLFTALSNYIIEQGGIIFGVVFNENMEVMHTFTDNIDGIRLMRGSKYVQSRIGNIFKEVKTKLKEGRKVLFTGTPCQVAGLYNFLRYRPENLYTCDVICHGTPSPLVFKKYVNYIQEDKNIKIKKYSFRDKTFGWKNYNTRIDYMNNNISVQSFKKDIYMRGFLKDLYLRNSCYNCNYKGDNILSDITIGDFWGIENKYPEIDDDRGLCAVLINTSKGNDILENIKNSLFIKKVKVNDILEGNPSLIRPVKKNKNREEFFKNINKEDIVVNIEKYTKENIFIKMKNKIRRLIGKTLRILKLR